MCCEMVVRVESGDTMQTVLRSMRPAMHRDGWLYIAPTAGIALVFFGTWGAGAPFWLAAMAVVALVFFFRDPDRVPPDGSHWALSAADGIFASLTLAAPPPELEMPAKQCLRVSVFLNLSDVHVTRMPVTGRVGAAVYRPGRKLSTALDKSSEDNERMAVRLDLPLGGSVAVCQIAGSIVRRIRCDVGEGAEVVAGDRYGLIRFGSRVDVYLPENCVPLVKIGQRSIAGETILADLRQPARPQ